MLILHMFLLQLFGGGSNILIFGEILAGVFSMWFLGGMGLGLKHRLEAKRKHR